MLASSQLDIVVGLDFHMEMLPTGPPAPFPMPFVGLMQPSPIGTLMSYGIGQAMSAAFGVPPSGPVLINGFQSTKTGDEAENKWLVPHVVIPPGVAWTPLPKPLKLKIRPGPNKPDKPTEPAGDAIMITGSKTVFFESSNACRLGDIAMSCGEPVRLPLSTLIAIPKGSPVIVGGPPALDYDAMLKALILRNKWMAGLFQQLCGLMPPGRFRNFMSWAACQLTGHPVDVATGRLLTRAEDYVLRGPIPLVFERFYSSAWADRDSPLGYGWSHTFDERVWVERGRVVYKCGDGREVEFHTYDLPGRAMREGDEVDYAIEGLTLRCLGQEGWSIRSRDGLVRHFVYLPGPRTASGTAHLATIRNRLGQSVTFAYDESRRLDTVRTSEGRWVRLAYEGNRLHRLAVPYPQGDAGGWYDKVTFAYSSEGDLVAANDSAGRARTYAYDRHLMVEETDRDGVSFYFEYDGVDASASCVRTWGDDKKGEGRLYFREIVYDRNNRKTFVEDSLGHTTVYEMNDANAVIKITDPRAASTRYEYDEHLRKVAEIDALGARTTFAYDARGNEISRTLPNGATLTTRYNEDNLPVVVDAPYGQSAAFTYDRYGRLLSRWLPGESLDVDYGDGVYPRRIVSNGVVFALEHDEFGQLVRTTFPDGSEENRRYDRQGRLVRLRDRGGYLRTFAYDLEGRVVQVDGPGTIQRTAAYSPEGDLVEYRDARRRFSYRYAAYHHLAAVDEAGTTIAYQRNSEGALAAIVNELGERYSFVFDGCGRVKEETAFDGREQVCTRDALGRVIRLYVPEVGEEQLTYDVMSNLTSVRYTDGTEARFTYDALGRVLTATNDTCEVRLDRDARGRVVRERQGDAWVARGYDGMGNVEDVRTSLGLAVHVGHDALGNVRAVQVLERAAKGFLDATWTVGFGRDLLGRETLREAPGGIRTVSAFGPTAMPLERTTTRGAERLTSVHYAWDDGDRLFAVQRGGHEVQFDHDARGRLMGARGPTGTQHRAPGPTGNLSRAEGGVGRRHGRGGVLLEAEGTRFGYDARGNTIRKETSDGSVWEYHWNGDGTLARVDMPTGTVAYRYDALGRRIEKRVGDIVTRYVWDGNVAVQEVRTAPDGASPEVTSWVYEPGSFAPAGKIGPDGARYSVVTDYLGTPTEMYDEAGALAWQAQLDIYGIARADVGEKGACPFRWPGQYEDEETGLYYNRFRYYDPQRGGYLSKDPIGLRGGLEPYGYVWDPLGETDVFGLSCSSDAKELRENMEAKGTRAPPYPNAAHHIVMSNSSAPLMVGARDHLASLNIPINSAPNGVLLPRTMAVASELGNPNLYHGAMHSNVIIREVSRAILSTTTAEQASQMLKALGRAMRKGRFTR